MHYLKRYAQAAIVHDMSIVYVLGAGASFGETLRPLGREALAGLPRLPGVPDVGSQREAVTPPLAAGFFSADLLRRLGSDLSTLARDFPEAVDYVAERLSIPHPKNGDVGDRWDFIDLESIFTSIEMDVEFWGVDSDYGCRCILSRNSLQRLILRILGLCTWGHYGECAKTLASALQPGDSVISFNWDLLFDRELLPAPEGKPQPQGQYRNFVVATLEGNAGMQVNYPSVLFWQGVYLKMHGSVNWFQCTNRKCPASQAIVLWENDQACLARGMGIHWANEMCDRCGSTTEPLIVPPLLRKPITENWIVRSTWGLAHRKLLNADVAVVIGFSIPTTDFSARWLLHSTVGLRSNVRVFVVNPDNDRAEFIKKMADVFPQSGFNKDFRKVTEISDIVAAAKAAETEMQTAEPLPGQRA